MIRNAIAVAVMLFWCSVGTDDTTRPIPADLVSTVNRVFKTALPPQVAMDSTVFRCAEGHVLACTASANLPCGKANTDRAPTTGAVQWCRDHPDATFIPAVATGHDSIFEWRCRSNTPQIARQSLHVDRHGFIATFWKVLR
jgi:hypothetical protein